MRDYAFTWWVCVCTTVCTVASIIFTMTTTQSALCVCQEMPVLNNGLIMHVCVVFFLVRESKAESELAKCHPEASFWQRQQWVRWNARLVTGYALIGLKWGYCPRPPSYYVFINVFFSLSLTFTLKQGTIFMTKRYAVKVSPPPPLENWNPGVPALIACRFDSKNVCAPSWQQCWLLKRQGDEKKGVKGMSHPELANCHHRPRGESRRRRREGREDKADCSNTLTHIIISVWSVGWRKREGRLKPRSGTDGYTCPLSSSLPLCLVLPLSLSLAHLPSLRVLRVKIVYLSLSCSLSVSQCPMVQYSSWCFSLSLSLSPPHMGPSILPDSPLPPCRRDSLLIPGSLELMN